MADIVDKKTRSRMMAGIKGKNTKPELVLRRALHARGFRFRLHGKEFPGRPDLVFPKHGAVIFVHGCFWHRHSNCRYATNPSTRMEFWQGKFDANVAIKWLSCRWAGELRPCGSVLSVPQLLRMRPLMQLPRGWCPANCSWKLASRKWRLRRSAAKLDRLLRQVFPEFFKSRDARESRD